MGSFGGGFMGGMAGMFLGGMVGRMLFGGMGGMGGGFGGGGGIGLLEILLIGGGIFLLMRYLRNRQAPAYGSHYGGSLYSMCDPYFMLILIEKLGRDYIVWDKAATIHFRQPGHGKMIAEFSISDERVDEIRAQADRGEKVEPRLEARVLNEEAGVVAIVEKLLYVRRRDSRKT